MKNIVVTGTSRGIGFELIKILAKEGNKILAVSRNIEPLKKLQLQNVISFSCDVTNEDEIIQLKKVAEEKLGKVDILINNAGAIVNKRFSETDFSDFEKVYRTNVFGVAAVIKVLLPLIPAEGHVLNISSMGGIQGSVKFPGLAAYSSSKGAVITLTELLAEEYKEEGPSFNVLALGAVQTEMLEEAFPGYQAPITADEMASYISNFAVTGNKFYNGKVLQVSSSTP